MKKNNKKTERTCYRVMDVLDYFRAVEKQMARGYNIAIQNNVAVIPNNLRILAGTSFDHVNLQNEPVYFCDSEDNWYIYQASYM